MSEHRSHIQLWAGIWLALVSPSGAMLQAQERIIVSSETEISSQAASLDLEFDVGPPFTATLASGAVLIDGALRGNYPVGGAADRAWRDLLAGTSSLSGRQLARYLEQWSPGSDISGRDLDVLVSLDDALARAVGGGATAPDNRQRDEARLRALLGTLSRSSNLGSIASALGTIDLESAEIHINDDVTVEADQSTAGGLLLVRGHLELLGRIPGDVVALDGSITMGPESRIEGDLHLSGTSLERRGGQIGGRLLDSSAEVARDDDVIRDRIREEVRRELARERASRAADAGIASGIGRLVHELTRYAFTMAALGLIIRWATRLAGDRVRVITREAARNPARCAAIGFAGAFLAIPAYLLGGVVLTISVVGIIGLPFWVLLFPVAVVLGLVLGLVSVCQPVGRWILRRDYRWLDWVDRHHPLHVRLTGAATLFAPLIIGSVLGAFPLIGWGGPIVAGLGKVAMMLAVMIGLGAVLGTRAGYRPSTWAYMDDDGISDAVPGDEWFSGTAADEARGAVVDQDEVGAGPVGDVGDADDGQAGTGPDRDNQAP